MTMTSEPICSSEEEGVSSLEAEVPEATPELLDGKEEVDSL